MLKKISLSAMTFTYLFAGIFHFTRFNYFLSIVPPFLPYRAGLVAMTGGLEILLATLLPFPLTRRWACYGLMLLLSISLPINVYIVSIGGAGIPLSPAVIWGRIPFQLLLMAWAYWHSRMGKVAGRPLKAGI